MSADQRHQLRAPVFEDFDDDAATLVDHRPFGLRPAPIQSKDLLFSGITAGPTNPGDDVPRCGQRGVAVLPAAAVARRAETAKLAKTPSSTASAHIRGLGAALLLAASAAFTAALLTAHYSIAVRGELWVPLVAASAFAAWFIFGLVSSARALPAVLATAFTPALVSLEPPAQVALVTVCCTLVVGTVLAVGSKRVA